MLNINNENNFTVNNFSLNGGNINLSNGKIGDIVADKLTLNGDTNIMVDIDLAKEAMDRLTPNSFVYTGGNINVSEFNAISDNTKSNFKINFVEDNTLKAHIKTDVKNVYGPIYNYAVNYDSKNGDFIFSGGGNNAKGYNPSILASPVATQLGGYLTQLNSYDEAFRNMDMYMLMTKKQRQAMKLRNKYATTKGNMTFDTTSTPYSHTAGWFRPYATFENVSLKHGPKVSNVAYGSFFGAESEMYDLGNGWDGIWGAYIGYNGSHQSYNGIGIYQNGGTLGAVGMAYKGNFFTGLTLNVGANTGDANTMYGSDKFSMLMSGIASKTGYNIEMADGKFIVQPNFLMSYSFVNTFDYTNSAGVSVHSSPLNAIQVEPGVKFISNLKNGWQPYFGISMVWNIIDKTNFSANNVSLPDLSIKPFVKYGIGVRKTWGEKITGFFQCYFTNGGRNGVGLQTGFRWAIGKTPSDSNKQNSTPQPKKTAIKLNNNRLIK